MHETIRKNREKNSIEFLRTEYNHESAVANRELDQVLWRWAVMSQFDKDMENYENLAYQHRY